MEDDKECSGVKVKIGELFENFDHLNKKQRVKTNHEVQEFVAERFKEITGFSVSKQGHVYGTASRLIIKSRTRSAELATALKQA